MTAGLATALINSWLNTLRNTSYSETAVAVKLHTGDPGSAGTSNASAETTRKTLTLSAASAGSMAISSTVSWAAWSAGSETITHLSFWNNTSGGTFLWSAAVASSRAVVNGDTLTLSTCTFSVTPVAA